MKLCYGYRSRYFSDARAVDCAADYAYADAYVYAVYGIWVVFDSYDYTYRLIKECI